MKFLGISAFGAALTSAVAGAFASAAVAGPPDLDATITYETRQVLASGVVRNERWQETLLRRGDSVWAERVLPASARAAHSHESAAQHAGHKHFDFDSAARLVQRDRQGATVLRYVDTKNRVVVTVPAAEYGAVGFDGVWGAAAQVVPPEVVARMPSGRGTAQPGARWLADHADGWTHRVLWSDARSVALRIESSRDDGSFSRRVTVAVAPSTRDGESPWSDLGSYTQKEYDDFMD